MSQLSCNEVLLTATFIKEVIEKENLVVNLGGLEPLLWHNPPSRKIHDLVRELTESGFEVQITTNGALLAQFVDLLIEAGVSKFRISIHSFDTDVYHRITGQDTLQQVLSSIVRIREQNVDVSLNRTLLKRYTDDMPSVLDFVTKHDLTLKLYDLLWTEWITSEWEKYYLPWQNVVKQYVLPLTKRVSLSKKVFHRPRLQYHLKNGGKVEVKVFNKKLHRHLRPCSICPFSSVCQETIGDYIYVSPDEILTLCHHRPDLSINLSPIITSLHHYNGVQRLYSRFYSTLGKNWKKILQEGNLTFYINSSCNYSCSFPNRQERTERLWCMSPLRIERLGTHQ